VLVGFFAIFHGHAHGAEMPESASGLAFIGKNREAAGSAVHAVCAALSKPFNFMVGIKGRSFAVAELAAAGVRRISLATSLYRAGGAGLE
jgi:hydrogenase/urease accessory protein HupE